ncbi:lysozyme g-like [Xyrauchen texanus]|uniref:lysozyme g-like n=1 Tax=Xyrauchen texanus TaxID=154827 RepID=UPI00224197C8|nr:lysozyme g-like [Xyrauchen texanus]
MACLFGDIKNIGTTGASQMTAQQDRLSIKGVEASRKLAERDLPEMGKYKGIITSVSRAKRMDPAVIAAIISRETRAGAVQQNGWGDNGNAFGLMQVDKRYHTPVGAWDSEQHVAQATNILIGFITEIKAKFPLWSQEQCFKGGISAYNAGVGNVRTYDHMDVGTTGEDYANDVVARAQWFKSQGY